MGVKVVRAVVTSADVQMQEVGCFGDPVGGVDIVIGVSLHGTGYLSDQSQASFTIKPTPDEQRRLLALFEEIAARIAAED